MRISKSNGFSMIEVLVALVIISLGVLSLLRLVNGSLGNNLQSSYQTNANYLVATIADRMRLNPATNYVGVMPSGAAVAACHAAGCSRSDTANNDVYEWLKMITESLPAGTGVISGTGPYLVEITWKKPSDVAASTVRAEVTIQ